MLRICQGVDALTDDDPRPAVLASIGTPQRNKKPPAAASRGNLVSGPQSQKGAGAAEQDR
jgi:hypothetical protein